MAKINSYILQYQPKDYAGTSTENCLVNCSLGVSYLPLPEHATRRLAEIPQDVLKHYPHDDQLISLLVDRFSTLGELSAENFCLGCGSFDLLCNINLLYAGRDQIILGHAPQFSAYVDHAHCIGADYRYYPFAAENGYQLDVDAFVFQIMRDKPRLICCENPNNPTGQVLNPQQLEQLILAAATVDAAIVFDEAYGDYLPLDRSAIQFVPHYSHVFVTRTFSKGFGIAGMRIGYAVGATQEMQQLRKLVTPFNCNAPARTLAATLLQEPDLFETLSQETLKKNQQLYAGLQALPKLHLAQTDPLTPICLLYVHNQEIDLCRLLAQVGIATVSGLSYDNLGQNAVRMMLCDEIPKLLELLKKAEELI